MAKYEAFLSGMRLAKKIRARKIILFTDSKFIAQQVLRDYEVRDPLLAKYHNLVRQIWANFENIIERQIF